MRKYAILALLAIVPVFAARLTLRDGTVVYGRVRQRHITKYRLSGRQRRSAPL